LVVLQTTEAFDTTAKYHFSESSGRTRLDLSLKSKYHLAKYPLLRLFLRLMSPVVNFISRRQIEKDLAKLKALAEG
jgi:hypothetical protein